MYVHDVHKSGMDRYNVSVRRSRFDVLMFLKFIAHILRCTGHSRPHNIQLRKHEPDKQTICVSVSESNIEYSVRYTLREH